MGALTAPWPPSPRCSPRAGGSASRCSTALEHGGVEGEEGLAGGVEIGAWPQGLTDAVKVESFAHGAEHGAEDHVHMMLLNVLNDLGQDRGGGVVDIADGGAVEDHPA